MYPFSERAMEENRNLSCKRFVGGRKNLFCEKMVEEESVELLGSGKWNKFA